MNAAADAAMSAGLTRIAAAAAQFRDPWWIIGSAAARLLGADVGPVRDLDLFMSVSDAERLVDLWSDEPWEAAAPHPTFRSAIFRRFTATPLPIEAMGGFEICRAEGWSPVTFTTRIPVAGVYVPDPAEQIGLLRRLGRDKDRARIAALAARAAPGDAP